jgi:hypothetical protein
MDNNSKRKVNNEIKYQIFISSTFKDLSDVRKIVTKAILQTNNFPIALDTFSASDEQDRVVIDNSISGCDFVILILGHRYGEVIKNATNDNLSFTAYEFELAKKYNKPILSFILNRDEVNQRRQKEFGKSLNEDTHYKDYVKFLNDVKEYSSCSYWSYNDLTDFSIKVTAGIVTESNKLSGTNINSGWVRALNYQNSNFIELALKNEFYFDTIRRLNEFKKLDERCSQYSAQKDIAASFFLNKLLDKIISDKKNIFLESGSSIAYVAKKLGTALSSKIIIDDNGAPSLDIKTNNILAYFQLWLINRIPSSFFPWGCPEEPYGASYGPITDFGITKNDVLYDKEPLYDLSPLDEKANHDINNLLKLPFGIPKERNYIMLGAISGIQISDRHNITTSDGYTTSDAINKKINTCYGFHVGSYSNKIFKRYLYKTNNPLVIFIDEEKIDCPVKAGICHFVFDNRYSWEEFISNYPLAFFIGCSQNKVHEIVELFENKLKFTVEIFSENKPITAIYAKNTKFPY